MTRRQIRSQLAAGAIGLASTLAVVLIYLAGGLDWLEYRTLDLRFRYANRIPADRRITCIDMDDEAVEDIHRWPWPRDWQAQIIGLLGELHAAAILVDYGWLEPETMRLETPRDADLAYAPMSLPAALAEPRYPDLVMAATLREVGNVFVAATYKDAAASTAAPRPAAARSTAGSAAAPASAPPGAIDAAALDAQVRAWLAEHRPDPREVSIWWPRLHARFTDQPIENETALKAQLSLALLRALGYDATMRLPFADPARVASVTQNAHKITPVHHLIAAAARGFGFVDMDKDSDGVVRRQTLLVEHDGRLLPQLALAVACFVLKAGPDDISSGVGRFLIERPAEAGGRLRIQVDAQGRMLIPWLAQREWQKQFMHVPVGPIWEVCDKRRMIAQNQRAYRDGVERVLENVVDDADAYARRLQACKSAEQEAQDLRLVGRWREAAAASEEAARLRLDVESMERSAREKLRSRLDGLSTQPSETNKIELDKLQYLQRLLQGGQPILDTNRSLATRIDELLAELRPRVGGKVCLFGYTATAVADMVPTPTHPSTPGVMAHASIVNGILTGATLQWTSAAANALLAAVLGLMTTALAAWRRPRENFAYTVALAALFVLTAGWAAFYFGRLWIGLTPGLGAIFVSALSINAYRYTFVDRERRQLSAALGQYTSKEIARQVAENPELCRRAESREVTAMFTDLQGFTGISERIGAERTQRVLNVCLGSITEVMLRHEAMVNKFIGDGVFSFWNPVIYPQPRHARLACETAVDLMAEMAELTRRQQQAGGDPAFAELVLRIGVASGNAVVGPCGSEQKYDYTCIGDSVNVAARLESANKFYGTRVLVSGPTRDAAGDGFVFRAMGGVRVKGKQQAVAIYELLGRIDQLDGALREYAESFSRTVADFVARRFQAAGAAFAAFAQQRPLDRAARVFAAAAADLAAHPPAGDWDGALEMTEK